MNKNTTTTKAERKPELRGLAAGHSRISKAALPTSGTGNVQPAKAAQAIEAPDCLAYWSLRYKEQIAAELERVKAALAEVVETDRGLGQELERVKGQLTESQKHCNANAAAYDKKYDECEELLAALKAMLQSYAPMAFKTVEKHGEQALHSSVRNARSAIAKAEGRAQ